MKFSHKFGSSFLFIGAVVLLLLTLGFFSINSSLTYSGNILRHFAIETSGGFIAIFTAALAYNSTITKKTILLSYIAVAMLTVGLIDILHAILSIDYFNIVVSDNSYFIPGTWTIGRTFLSIVFLIGLLNYKVFPSLKISPVLLFSSSLTLSTILFVIMMSVKLPAFILNDYFIHRPWELLSVLFFLASLIIIYKYRATFPAYWYGYGFFILSILVQLIMAFSLELYSAFFDISHLLKITSYIYVTIPILILMKRRSKKSLNVAVGRTQAYLLLIIIFGMILLLNTHAYYLTNEKKSIDNLHEQKSILCLSRNVFNSHKRFPSTLTDEDSNKIKYIEYQKNPCKHNHYQMLSKEYNIDLNGFISHYYFLLDKIILANTNNEKDLYKSLYAELNNYTNDKINPTIQFIIEEESDQVLTQTITDKRSLSLYLSLFFLLTLFLSPLLYVFITNILKNQFAPLYLLTSHIKSIYHTGIMKKLELDNTYSEIKTMQNSFNKMIYSVIENKKNAQQAQRALEQNLEEKTSSLALARDHLKRVVNNVGDAIFTSNTKGEIESVNKAGLDMFGYELSELMGKNVKILQPEHIKVRHDDIVKNYLKSGKGHLMGQAAIEATAKRKNGELFPIEITITETKKGEDHTFIALIKDIALRKNAERAIRKNKERMIKFLDSSSEGLFFHNKGIITDANQNGVEFLGLNIGDIKGHHINEYFEIDGIDCQGERVKNHNYECFIFHDDGTKGLVNVLDKDIIIDDVSYSVLSIRDISELQHARDESEQILLELTNLIDTANAPIFGIDGEGKVTEWNQSAEKITGYKKEGVLGHDLVQEFITKEYKKSVSEVLHKALVGQETSNYEFPLYAKDGSHRLVLLNATPRKDLDGNVTGVIGIGQDITEIDKTRKSLSLERENLNIKVSERTKDLEKSLTNLVDINLKLEEVNRHKGEFISSMSHELRTPLNGIIGSADLLHEQLFGELNTKQLSYTAQIGKSADHLLSLINDLLDMAKIDAGTLELEIEKLYINEWVTNSVGIMRTEFRKKHINIHTDISTRHDHIEADIRKCNQIILNLLSNAAKYTPEGSDIYIRISDENGEYIRIEVEDRGIGIELIDRERIFDQFYQVDRKRDENLGGTGIGLALTKRLIEIHGGHIGVKNTEGGSALFFFTLPAKQNLKLISSDLKTSSDQKTLLSNKKTKILIAEDNPVNASLLVDMLSTFNYTLKVVENGQLALDIVQDFRPDIILMDIDMPIMNGFEATQKLRAMTEFSKTPIITITASVTEESKTLQFEAGCTDHIPKPIKRKELLNVLSRYIK